jgi:hypothetical protein
MIPLLVDPFGLPSPRCPARRPVALPKVLPLLAVVLLSSCITVDDFGAYWDKGFVDPALAGTWKIIGVPREALDGGPWPERLRFTKNGRSYALQGINPIDSGMTAEQAAEQARNNETREAARTLTIGRHAFLMQRPQQGGQDGMLVRYEVRGGILSQYIMDFGEALEFMAAKHPAARNITSHDVDAHFIDIQTFDDEVFQILSEIADVPRYWGVVNRYKKIS